MASDDERRRMARILRGGYDVAGDASGRFWLNGTLFGLDVSARSESDVRRGLLMLAEFIDPAPASSDAVPKCDCGALLVLAEELGDVARSYMAQCPSSVKTWVVAGRLESVASRIREALGVSQ